MGHALLFLPSQRHPQLTMTDPYIGRSAPSTTTFKDNIFAGKVLFCTGGGSGICNKMVEAVMRHGANAAIMGRKAERLQKAASDLSSATRRKCIATPGDVRNYDHIANAVEETVKQFGRLDYVICGAAGNFLAPIEGISPKGFKTVQEIDLMGTYNTVKATLDHLKKSHGAYIHVSATLHYFAIPWQAAPSAAKAGIDSLSQSIAVEMGPFGVRSNVIAPGMIAGTEGADRLTPKGGEDYVSQRIPLQRIGQKDDIANMAVYLFSDAGAYCSGTKFVVDGGAVHTTTPWLPYPDSSLDQKTIGEFVVGSKL